MLNNQHFSVSSKLIVCGLLLKKICKILSAFQISVLMCFPQNFLKSFLGRRATRSSKFCEINRHNEKVFALTSLSNWFTHRKCIFRACATRIFDKKKTCVFTETDILRVAFYPLTVELELRL